MKRETNDDTDLIKKRISRRTLLRLGAAGAMAFLAYRGLSYVKNDRKTCGKRCHVVIVGGGMAGCAIANRLSHQLTKAKITIIEPDETSVSYQPGQTFVGAGIWKLPNILANSADYFPKQAAWIKNRVVEFVPDRNEVITESNRKIRYDFLIVTTGLKLDYSAIEGMSEDLLGKRGITSIYSRAGAVKTWEAIQYHMEKAVKQRPVKWVFTHPKTPIKCSGASKKILFLAHNRIVDAGVAEQADMAFYTSGASLFNIPEYHDALVNQFNKKKLPYHLNHNLAAIDPGKKLAIFDCQYEVWGEYDEDLGEYDTIIKTRKVNVPYDFIHITPPMRAPDAVKNSELAYEKGAASEEGWVEVDFHTLQHRRFPNVFALGDVAGIPMAKTGASVRKQYKIVADNLIAVIEDRHPSMRYNGYTACPIITSIGKAIMAEFDWSGKPTPTIPIDPKKERWIWWLVEMHLSKPMVYMGMLKGRY